MNPQRPNISRAQMAPPQSAPFERAVLRLVPQAGRAFIVAEDGRRWASGVAPALEEVGPEPILAALREGCTGERVFAWGFGLNEAPPGYWGREAWERLEATIAAVAPALADRGARLLLRPRHGRTLADVPGALRLLNGPFGERLGIILDAAAMLAPSTVAGGTDHLRRAFESLGPRAEALVLSNVASAPGGRWGDGERLAPAPLRAGLVDADLLLALAREHVPEGTLRVWLEGDPEAPRAAGRR